MQTPEGTTRNWTLEELLTVPEAAQRKGVGLTTLYRAVNRRELPALRLAGLLFVHPADLDAYNPRFLRRRRLRTRRAARLAESNSSKGNEEGRKK